MWLLVTVFLSCSSQSKSEVQLLKHSTVNQDSTSSFSDEKDINKSSKTPVVITAANQTREYFDLIKNKKIGIVANHTSLINNSDTAVHLVDSLLNAGFNIKIVFSPEHGFRGDHDAGANINHSTDNKTGLPIFSLHGRTKKPSVGSLKGVEIVVFDIQDVGARFYTYISTLHYVMEACAENNIPVLVLDRPNPNAFYISGPVLEAKQKSFIGMHPVPVVYGMSIGEYAQMINGEFWLKDSVQCELNVVKLKNWDHKTHYTLPVAPSPNLNNQLSIYLYPHLCFFEGTDVSVGRGTPYPFQQYGHPLYSDTSYSFTPVSIKGASLYPPQQNKQCFGKDLRSVSVKDLQSMDKLDLNYLMDAYSKVKSKDFFLASQFINLLAGNSDLQKDIKEGKSLSDIYKSWEEGIADFLLVRAKYLLY